MTLTGLSSDLTEAQWLLESEFLWVNEQSFTVIIGDYAIAIRWITFKRNN